jgi:hypothetical protein
MDPFLEHADHFPGFHDRLTTYLSEALQPRLPEPYYVDIGERVWVEVSRRHVEPDVNVLRPRGELGRPEKVTRAAVAAESGTVPVEILVPHDECREPFLQIFLGPANRERLVTTVEILSLTNKTPGEHGRKLYRRKQREMLDSKVHLVEIDLLRGGTHTTAVPRDRLRHTAPGIAYHACIHRFDEFEKFFVYPVALRQRLPEICIPLLPGDGEVAVDLQALMDRCYDTGPYRRRLCYADAPLMPPLNPDDLAWARQILREKGLVPP